MNDNLIPKVIRFVQASSALGKRAMDEVKTHRAAHEKAASMKPTLVKLMLDTGTIKEGQKTAAENMLDSHEQTMVLLKNAVARISELERQNTASGASMGRGVDEKTASDGGASPAEPKGQPISGLRTSEKKASDVALFRGLGLPA